MISCDCSVDSSDFEAARCTLVTIRKARKKHECCECDVPILPGKKYEDTTGISNDGDPFQFRTCLPCSNIRKHYCPSGWIWGELANTIYECLGWDYRDPASSIPDCDDGKSLGARP